MLQAEATKKDAPTHHDGALVRIHSRRAVEPGQVRPPLPAQNGRSRQTGRRWGQAWTTLADPALLVYGGMVSGNGQTYTSAPGPLFAENNTHQS